MSDSPAVLITGCSSGIGRATARVMRDRGWRVLATARKAEDLEVLDREGLEAVELDVASADSVAACAEAARGVRALVNNAGYGEPGALEDLTREAMRRQFEVNVIGLQDLTNRLLPPMVAAGHGRIVHVSSVVGRVALPFMGIYSASKFAVEALADAQRVELDGTGVRVSLVEPGPIVTRFFENAAGAAPDLKERTDSRFAALYRAELESRDESRRFALPPEAVARKIAHALTAPRPRRRYPVTLPARFGALMRRVAPDALLDAILTRELRRRKRTVP